MAQEPLVELDIIAGRELVMSLDQAGIGIVGAFWLYMTEADQWKLLIVTHDAASGARALYRKAIELHQALDLTKVQFVPPSTPVFKALSGAMRITGLDNVRLTNNMLNGVYVDDALVYRLAA